MRKQVKLPPQKNNKKPIKSEKKDGFVFFVKDQGEGVGKVFVIILKVIELILTTIFALMLGIFAPLCIWFGNDIVPSEVAADPSAVWWLVSSIVYIIGLFFVMFGLSKIATGIHLAAAAGTLMTYHYYLKLYEGLDSNGPTSLYMPSIFITVATIGIMLIINIPKWLDKREQKANEEAPSILGDRKKK